MNAFSNHLKKPFFSWEPGFRIRAAREGDSVRATIPDITIAIAMVMANCLYKIPVMPPRKATGRKTDTSTRTMAMRALASSAIDFLAASIGVMPKDVIIMLDRFDNDDCIINHKANREDHAEKG